MACEHFTEPVIKQNPSNNSLDAYDKFIVLVRFAWVVLSALFWGLTWPFRRWWFRDAAFYIIGPTGYRAVLPAIATLVGAYAGAYAIAEARHERHLNRALFERNAFLTMAVSGRAGFFTAMQRFGRLQNTKIPSEPSLSRPPWRWRDKDMPNRIPLQEWAHHFMRKCESQICGALVETSAMNNTTEGRKPWRIDLGRTDLRGTDLRSVDFSGANLWEANLAGSNLTGADMIRANLIGANLFGANLTFADLNGANLIGTGLSLARLELAHLRDLDLRSTLRLNQNQINSACVYGEIKLPRDVKRPDKNPEFCKHLWEH